MSGVVPENIERAASEVYLRDGTVAEIRAFGEERGWKKTYSGWFDDPESFVAEVLRLEKAEFEVYSTLNPCKGDLLARGCNKLVTAKSSTSDDGILQRRWIPVDLDPKRESGVSATDEEKAAAYNLALRIRADLAERGIPSVLADSGNGFHLLIPVDLPNTPARLALVDGFLKALDARYSTEAVDVDVTVANGADHEGLRHDGAQGHERREDRTRPSP
jgi:hypothetical protein